MSQTSDDATETGKRLAGRRRVVLALALALAVIVVELVFIWAANYTSTRTTTNNNPGALSNFFVAIFVIVIPLALIVLGIRALVWRRRSRASKTADGPVLPDSN
jgi:heme/copper-type cytochrome/quinol oxidase subunit 2